MTTIMFLILGATALVLGAEMLVRGASRIASSIGVSNLVIGLTVVAYGTSAPELAVSVQAALGGSKDIAVGNVIGSNIFNILLILGLSSVITPLAVDRAIIRREVPILIGVSLLVFAFASTGNVSLLEGVVLLTALVCYTLFQLIGVQKSPAGRGNSGPTSGPRGRTQLAVSLGMSLVGLGLLVAGADWFVEAASSIARKMGVSELAIGLTIVAGGTSLPEVATSVVAAARGQRDIAVGNVIGSNLFNLLGVLGASAMVAQDGLGVSIQALQVDFPAMIAVTFLALPVMISGGRISRWEGLLFLGLYVLYVTNLVHLQNGSFLFGASMAQVTGSLVAISLVGILLTFFQLVSRRQYRTTLGGRGK
ncbi:calcium/sodium antiporter [bacterium]|nr:calcium/sodium antiporter [bacterium]